MMNINNNSVQYATIASETIFLNNNIASNVNPQISSNEQRSLPDMANNIFDCENLILRLDVPTFITSPGFPFFYMFGQNIICHLTGSTGRGIEVIVYEVSLESQQNDYLLLNPGDQNAPMDRAIIFTSELDRVFKYWFHDTRNLIVQFVSPMRMSANMRFRGFNMSAQYIEEYIPRPEEGDKNEIAIPIEPRDNHTVYLDGLIPTDFINISQEFIQILADMATIFTQIRDLPQGEFPMIETVHLRLITRCRLSWPNSDNCTAVTFSIPTFWNETDGHYELNSPQLRDMWEMFHRSTVVIEELAELGLTEYTLPNDSLVLTLWLVCSGAVVVAMIMVAIFIAQYDYFGNYKSVERYTETDTDSVRRKSSLYPAPHQDIPAMFHEDNQDLWDNDLAYADYDNNGVSLTNNGFVKDGELFDLDSDEEIIMSLPDGPPNKPQLKREMDA